MLLAWLNLLTYMKPAHHDIETVSADRENTWPLSNVCPHMVHRGRRGIVRAKDRFPLLCVMRTQIRDLGRQIIFVKTDRYVLVYSLVPDCLAVTAATR
jgi:hypothetical protein